jgi:dUTPase
MGFSPSWIIRRGSGCHTKPKFEDSSSLTIYANESGTLKPGANYTCKSGFEVRIPEGWVGLLTPKTQMALKGIAVLAQTLPSKWDDEFKIQLVNNSDQELEIRAGDPVIKLTIVPCIPSNLAFFQW